MEFERPVSPPVERSPSPPAIWHPYPSRSPRPERLRSPIPVGPRGTAPVSPFLYWPSLRAFDDAATSALSGAPSRSKALRSTSDGILPVNPQSLSEVFREVVLRELQCMLSHLWPVLMRFCDQHRAAFWPNGILHCLAAYMLSMYPYSANLAENGPRRTALKAIRRGPFSIVWQRICVRCTRTLPRRSVARAEVKHSLIAVG